MSKISSTWSGSFLDRPNSKSFNISYTAEGNDGPVVLMIHGFLTNRQQFFALQSLMSPYCRTIAIDLLGLGDSTKFVTGGTDFYSWKNDAAYIRTMMIELYPDERFMIIGDHWGSCVGFTYASIFNGDVFGVVNINSIIGSNNMSLIERQISRWNRLNGDSFNNVLSGFETTLSTTLQSFATKSCLWSDKCMQVFMVPYYTWKSVGGTEITYTTSSSVPVDVTKTIGTNSVGRGGVEDAVKQMTQDVSTDIAADISDDGMVNSSNRMMDTADVDLRVQNSINAGFKGSFFTDLDPNTPVTLNTSLGESMTGTVRRTRTSTRTSVPGISANNAGLVFRGNLTDVTVPAVVNVVKEIDVTTGGRRMVAEIDRQAVQALSERAESSYRERVKPLSVNNIEGIDYNMVNVPQMFITGCKHSLGVQDIGWKMLNSLRVMVRVVELEGEGQLVTVENPKKIANIVLEFIINIIGADSLAARFDGYDRKPATAMCSWVSDEMYSYTVTT